MIKVVFCLRRLATLSPEEFHQYWLRKHAPLVREHAATLGIRRYVQNHGFSDPRIAPALDARGSVVAAYDGVAELWWDSLDDVLAAGSTREARAAGRALLEDERRFIDLPNSPIFYAREHEIIALDVPART